MELKFNKITDKECNEILDYTERAGKKLNDTIFLIQNMASEGKIPYEVSDILWDRLMRIKLDIRCAGSVVVDDN